MSHSITAGDLLIAAPMIKDQRFQNSVILLTDHDAKGSVGLVLNRATEYMVNDLITPLNVELTWDPHLFWGGPVAQDISFMLHSPEWSVDGYTRGLTNNWSVTQHWSMFVHLSDGDEPYHWRIFAGCCAWAPGQLDRELDRGAGSWLVLNDPDVAQLLDLEDQDIWDRACSQVATQTTSGWLA